MTTIGVQTMMLRNDFAADGVFAVLEKVATIGYRSLEISALSATEENLCALERARGTLGLSIDALSMTFPARPTPEALESVVQTLVRDAQRLGTALVRLGAPPARATRTTESAREFGAQLGVLARGLGAHGIELAYHNHHLDFMRYDSRYLLDVVADADPKIKLELDVHWIQRGGKDPVRTIHRYGPRVASVHLKDYRIARVGAGPYAALDAGDESKYSAALSDLVQFAEVGEGTLDMAAIVQACVEQEVPHMFVEQDETYGRTALDCLRTSHDNLVALGFGDLF
jgi:sugar phosphate isomerase/epimerase